MIDSFLMLCARFGNFSGTPLMLPSPFENSARPVILDEKRVWTRRGGVTNSFWQTPKFSADDDLAHAS